MNFFAGENKFKHLIINNSFTLLVIFISIISLLLRVSLRDFLSPDMRECLIPWYNQISNNGISSMAHQVGDYNIAYQFIIALFTYLPFNKVYMYKGLSILFDYLLAISGAMITTLLLSKEHNSKKTFILSYSTILITPTVWINSSLWGQCDCIYATFVLLSLYFLLKRNNIISLFWLGVAISFKLQTVFILPFFLLWWILNEGLHLWHFFVTLITFWVSGIPAYLLGRSLLSTFFLYLNQTNEYKAMFLGYFNFAGMFGKYAQTSESYYTFSKAFIFLTLAILAMGFVFFIERKEVDDVDLLKICCWSIYTCVLFLPAMHERYAFLVDILLIILVFVDNKYILVCILELLISTLGDIMALFHLAVPITVFSIISVMTFVLLTILCFYDFANHHT